MKKADRQARALRLFVQLTRAAEQVAGEVQPLLTDAALTAGQLGVLKALSEDGPLSLRQLGDNLYRSGPNMTTVVDNLERDGLVRRTRSEVDRRVVLVSSTKEGQRRFERAYPSYARSITAIVAGLSSDEQERLTRLCKKLRDGGVERALGPAA